MNIHVKKYRYLLTNTILITYTVIGLTNYL